MLPRLLLTGFGPFPGVETNPTEGLARAFTKRLSAASWGETSEGDCGFADRAKVRAEVLPVDWALLRNHVDRLLDSFDPDIVLHFGVSVRAAEIRIEKSAFNRTLVRPDRHGATPLSQFIVAGGTQRLDTPLPAKALAARLRASFHPARVSLSAGRYLCNYVYYHSLDWARRRGGEPLIGFVHVPPPEMMPAARLLDAAQTVVAFCLETHAARRPAREAAAAPLEIIAS